MREPATVRLLPDGHRLHLNDGPIDLIVDADGTPDAIRGAYEAAARRFVNILDELCGELPLLRAQASFRSPRPQGPIARCMADAVAPYRNRCFVTPMAAVAGAVAEAVLASMTKAANLDRVYVNNGGDIALHLAPGNSYRIGMVERPDHPSLFGSFEISAATPVRGVATSGWRGRSFSLGIADAVTVLASAAAQADAAATIIANAVNLPSHPAITRIPAREIAPESDLGDIPVTRAVGQLRPPEVDEALSRGERVAEELREQGLIFAAALCVQGVVHIVQSPLAIPPPLCGDGLLSLSANADDGETSVASRSLQHA
ncbi:MAG TPA: UPF0280 family protein [Candidatus Limnocylindrales bacterium]|nr:UPF0280 family protein [Candidatus Limnocylindrales bacterium]